LSSLYYLKKYNIKDVEGFLYNLFADPDIIRLPSYISYLQKPIAYFIAKRRAPKSKEAYASIGGGSPIVYYTKAQADLIQTQLAQRGLDVKAYFAMRLIQENKFLINYPKFDWSSIVSMFRYWHPFTEEVLEEMRNDAINAIVIIPLYPQFSISTSGSSLRLLQEIFYKSPEIWGPDKVMHTVAPAWYYRKGYVTAMANLIIKEVIDELHNCI